MVTYVSNQRRDGVYINQSDYSIDIQAMQASIQDNTQKIDEQNVKSNQTTAKLENQESELEKVKSDMHSLKLDSQVAQLSTAPEKCMDAVRLGTVVYLSGITKALY